jgi:hypothetical protein
VTTTVKVILAAALGLFTATAAFTIDIVHERGVVAELQREDHERLLERQHAAAKEQQDDAALKAYYTGQPIPTKSP